MISALHAHRNEDIKGLEDQKARSGLDVKLAIGTGPAVFMDRSRKEKIGDGEYKEKKELASTSAASSSEYGGKCKLHHYCLKVA